MSAFGQGCKEMDKEFKSDHGHTVISASIPLVAIETRYGKTTSRRRMSFSACASALLA